MPRLSVLAASSSRARVVVALFVLGTVLVQAAWVLTLPPFRGTDEFDHAFRAASVARGEWRAPTVPAQDGRGRLVVVPRDLVAAAEPVCSSYLYTGHDNCQPAADAGHGNVYVATAAGPYDPLFYWVIGAASLPFDGAGALYAMRVAAALLCLTFVGLSAWVTCSWARTAWPLVAATVAMTPVALFSMAVAAPNGLEMASGLCLWSSLLGIAYSVPGDGRRTTCLATALASGLVLTPLRLLGPLSLALIVHTFLVAMGARPLGRLVRQHPRLVPFVTGSFLAVALVSMWWTRSAGGTALESAPPDPTNQAAVTAFRQIPLWFFQGVAAFPRRMDAAPPVVYVTIGTVTLLLLGLGFMAASARLRVLLTGVLAAAVLIPLAATEATIATAGPIWQGRYGLPFHLGVVLLAGVALDQAAPRFTPPLALRAVGWTCLGLGQLVSVLSVLRTEVASSPLRDSASWVHPSAWVVGPLVVVGTAAWAVACGAGLDPFGVRSDDRITRT